MKMEQMKEAYSRLAKKTPFLVKVGKQVGKSPHTVRMWFSDHVLTSPMPQDKKILRVIERELTKAPKKEQNAN